MPQKTAIIIGAGPAGLTAAYELLQKTDIKPIVYEMDSQVGGISKTINYKENRLDIGGHRFFSKSDAVMKWWQNILHIQENPALDSENADKILLVRNRLSRIFFLRKFFDYPISLNWSTLKNLGFFRVAKIGISYFSIRLCPIKEEKTLEDFFINRFGRELYITFFMDYTQKVWGISCSEMKPEWGSQRVKGLSVGKTLVHAFKKIFQTERSLSQKQTETSLIERFLYPKYGPGQLWEEVARLIQKKGGEIHLQHKVISITRNGNKIIEADIENVMSGEKKKQATDYLFSTMPLKEFIQSLTPAVPEPVLHIAEGLQYRDFITVGLLLKKLKIKNSTKIKTKNNIIPDNWIYIQERDVKIGRLQIFNNWSPYLVKDPNTVWIGLEYFCSEGDELWSKSDEGFSRFAIDELAKIGIIEKEDVLDSVVIRNKKTYPVYSGTYEQLNIIRNFTDAIENLFLIGRNGMHRYNNQDHSMLTAMEAVENIIHGIRSKENIWNVNAEEEYLEGKKNR